MTKRDTAERERDDDNIRDGTTQVIIDAIAPFHVDKDSCPLEILVENLEIDFEHCDMGTLFAIVDALKANARNIAKERKPHTPELKPRSPRVRKVKKPAARPFY